MTGVSIGSVVLFELLPVKMRFTGYWLGGVAIHLLLFSCSCLLTALHDATPEIEMITNGRHHSPLYVTTITEPPDEKRTSWKSDARFDYIQFQEKRIFPRSGIILYIRKDSMVHLRYGSKIVFRKPPERITNFDSAFNYVRYCALRNIHFRIFLSPNEFIVLGNNDASAFHQFVFNAREWIVDLFRQRIRSPAERGLALALLIGYKNDLDKNLLQSYSNTGVVHVIAISGLHLGLIYSMLMFVCRPLGRTVAGKTISFAISMPALWIFTFLAGASPPVLRSAVMFSFIAAGALFRRKTPIINSLCASALFLLCINPLWLWDIGFLLSYLALLSIAVFNKPVYAVGRSTNRMADALWKLNAVTIAAQILTMPVILFYFHQFPVLFLITNMIAVPLSGIILFGEIILCSLHPIEVAACFIARLLTLLIRLMNGIILYADSLAFATIGNIHINFPQLLLLYVFTATITAGLMFRRKGYILISLLSALLFFIAEVLKYGNTFQLN